MSILFKGMDGSVAIMTLAPGADKSEAVRKFKEAHPDTYIDHFEFNGKLPSREFRDAWSVDTKQKIVIDKVKAKDIHLARIRHIRNLELDKLDKELIRYISSPDKLIEIEERKQLLRDIPQHVKGLEWPNQLEKI